MTTTNLFPSFANDLAEFLTDLRPELLRYCRSLTNRDWEAEDLVQDTMMRVLNRCGQTPGATPSKAYVYRTAYNLWIDHCRSSRRQLSVPFEELDSTRVPTAHTEMDALLIRELLAELMYHLTPKSFVIVLLCDVFRLTAKEAGSCINMEEGAVQVALSRARKRLRMLALHERDQSVVGGIQAFESRSFTRLLEAATIAFRRHDHRLIYETYLQLFCNGCRIADIRTQPGSFYLTLNDPGSKVLMVASRPGQREEPTKLI